MNKILWAHSGAAGTSLRAIFDEVVDVDKAIASLEQLADQKGDWELNDFGGWDWWGITGVYNGAVFSLYTHKSGMLKLGGSDDLDVEGAKAAVLRLLGKEL